MNRGMRFAYADPPYLGAAHKLYSAHHLRADDWNQLRFHRSLISWLNECWPDGWALSMGSNNLSTILPMCPSDVRVAAWIKPFVFFKPNQNPGYSWEPVIFRGGRKRIRHEWTIRDSVSAASTFGRGVPGAKPVAFCSWILDLLGWRPNVDRLDDLFPGTGIMDEVIAGREHAPIQTGLFA